MSTLKLRRDTELQLQKPSLHSKMAHNRARKFDSSAHSAMKRITPYPMLSFHHGEQTGQCELDRVAWRLSRMRLNDARCPDIREKDRRENSGQRGQTRSTKIQQESPMPKVLSLNVSLSGLPPPPSLPRPTLGGNRGREGFVGLVLLALR